MPTCFVIIYAVAWSLLVIGLFICVLIVLVLLGLC